MLLSFTISVHGFAGACTGEIADFSVESRAAKIKGLYWEPQTRNPKNIPGI